MGGGCEGEGLEKGEDFNFSEKGELPSASIQSSILAQVLFVRSKLPFTATPWGQGSELGAGKGALLISRRRPTGSLSASPPGSGSATAWCRGTNPSVHLLSPYSSVSSASAGERMGFCHGCGTVYTGCHSYGDSFRSPSSVATLKGQKVSPTMGGSGFSSQTFPCGGILIPAGESSVAALQVRTPRLHVGS